MSNENAHDTPEPYPSQGESQSPPPDPQHQAPPAEPPPRGEPRGWRSRHGYTGESSYGFDPRSKNAALACFLSLMPGLGQIYVGFYQRGFTHILVVGSTIALLSAQPVEALTPLLGIFLPFFWLYNIIDAGRRAGLYNHALQSGGGMEFPLEVPSPGGAGGSMFGGAILIGVGTIILSYTRFGMSLRWLEEWWPAAPILFGAWLVFKGMMASARGRQDV